MVDTDTTNGVSMDRDHSLSVEWVSQTSSTQDLAAQRFRQGRSTPFWIAAQRQTAGRGQYGRSWWSESGSLFCTGAIRFQNYAISYTPNSSGIFSLLIGLAVLQTVRPSLVACGAITESDSDSNSDWKSESHSTSQLGLHWPNDLFYGSRKLAGILIESPEPGVWLVGVGINVHGTFTDAPREVQERGISLEELGVTNLSLVELLEKLARKVERLLWWTARNPQQMLMEVRAHCSQVGRRVRVTQPGGDERETRVLCTGTCRGIADDGQLIVETDDGKRLLFASATVRIEN